MTEHTKEPESFLKKEPSQQLDQKAYNSNPFTLAINAFSRFFETNRNWAITLIVLSLASFAIQGINTVVDFATSSNSNSTSNNAVSGMPELGSLDPTAVIALIVGIGVVIIVTIIVSAVITTYVQGILSFVALQSEKGLTVSFNEALTATNQRFWRLFGAVAFSWLKILGWSLLFIIPGIVASIRYRLLPYVVMSQPAEERSVVSAHSRVKNIVKGRLLEVFGVSFAGSLIPIIGELVIVAGGAAQHNQLATAFDTDAQRPAVHWLNKLLLAFAIVIVLFIVLLAIAFVSLVTNWNF